MTNVLEINAKEYIINKDTDDMEKEIKNGNKIENIKLLPIIIKEILMEIKRANDAALASDPNAKLYDASDLVELVQLILKKSLKKTAFAKKSVDLSTVNGERR